MIRLVVKGVSVDPESPAGPEVEALGVGWQDVRRRRVGDHAVGVAVHMQIDRRVAQLAEFGLPGADHEIGAVSWPQEVNFEFPCERHWCEPVSGEHQ